MRRRRIAVVGAGISGLGAAWLLRGHHRVTLFESAHYAGGHTNTVDVTLEGRTFPVDTGFLVFNARTYPNLCALFENIGVSWVESDMSFSVRVDSENLEWAGSSVGGVFAQRRNLVRPEFWRMLQDILRFNREASGAVERSASGLGTLGEFLDRQRYGRAFRDWYLLPMGAAIWSCPAARMLDYPARPFLQFCHNHGLLQLSGRPRWRTVSGGGRSYVARVISDLDDVRLGSPVRRIRRADGWVEVVTDAGTETFDDVILATHADRSLAMLADPTPDEAAVLGAFRYQPNVAYLHTDRSLLPRAREAWSAWNYLAGAGRSDDRPVSVSYLINRLQPLPCETAVIVTLNPPREPDPDSCIRRIDYSHPVFDAAAIAAQQRLPGLQGGRRTWFCGAWTGHGFHEDGLRSAVAVANALGVKAPWQYEAVAA
ncbi:MAG: FAD-dependent oxidoreductase [Betaproteobacteria bacterium]|nr:FAD-dependent oxidoreductase [Betaproteobacteria bacterium]